MIALHDKYLAYVSTCFANSSLFHKALKEAFEGFCNKNVAGSTSAELMANFCDNLLKKVGVWVCVRWGRRGAVCFVWICDKCSYCNVLWSFEGQQAKRLGLWGVQGTRGRGLQGVGTPCLQGMGLWGVPGSWLSRVWSV